MANRHRIAPKGDDLEDGSMVVNHFLLTRLNKKDKRKLAREVLHAHPGVKRAWVERDVLHIMCTLSDWHSSVFVLALELKTRLIAKRNRQAYAHLRTRELHGRAVIAL